MLPAHCAAGRTAGQLPPPGQRNAASWRASAGLRWSCPHGKDAAPAQCDLSPGLHQQPPSCVRITSVAAASPQQSRVQAAHATLPPPAASAALRPACSKGVAGRCSIPLDVPAPSTASPSPPPLVGSPPIAQLPDGITRVWFEVGRPAVCITYSPSAAQFVNMTVPTYWSECS